ncbi:mucin-5AC [Drosophila miranda]|uniref:mucin-5AC n=1 Tax=Drosophila miranda TaxID=7229 RepID=UPI0007E75DE1|nr:mucin-5AC [Drosophila miranda]
MTTTLCLFGLGLCLLASIVGGWDYSVPYDYVAPYYAAPYYFAPPRYGISPCPPTGEESVVCAVAPGAQPATFPSPCEVDRFSRQTGVAWKIIYEDRCDKMEECPDACNEEFRPICATFRSSRRTFRNYCELLLVTCRTDHQWKILHDGTCDSRLPPLYSPRARSYNPYEMHAIQPSYGPYGSYRSQPLRRPQTLLVSPPPPYKVVAYEPYEISLDNLPTEYQMTQTSSKAYSTTTHEPETTTQEPQTNTETTESIETTGFTVASQRSSKVLTVNAVVIDNETSTEPNSTTFPTKNKPNPTYGSTPIPSTEVTSTFANPLNRSISINAVALTIKSTTETSPETTYPYYSPTSTPEKDSTTDKPLGRSININAVSIEDEDPTEPSSTASSLSYDNYPSYPVYNTTAPPEHATTTARPSAQSIRINAVAEIISDETSPKQSSGVDPSTEASSTVAPSSYEINPSFPATTSYTSYLDSSASASYSPTAIATTEEASNTVKPLLKSLSLNAVAETKGDVPEEETTLDPSTEASSTVEPSSYETYPSYQASPSYLSYSDSSAYASYSPTAIATTEEASTTVKPLLRSLSLNAVAETKGDVSEEETSLDSSTEESPTVPPSSYETYPSYPASLSYPSYSDSSAYASYSPTAIATSEEASTTVKPLLRSLSLNAVAETKADVLEEETTLDSSTEESPTVAPSSYETYPSYPASLSYPSYSDSSAYASYSPTAIATSEEASTTVKPLLRSLSLNAVAETKADVLEEETTLDSSTEESPTVAPSSYETYPSYPASLSYPSYSDSSSSASYSPTAIATTEEAATTVKPLLRSLSLNAVANTKDDVAEGETTPNPSSTAAVTAATEEETSSEPSPTAATPKNQSRPSYPTSPKTTYKSRSGDSTSESLSFFRVNAVAVKEGQESTQVSNSTAPEVSMLSGNAPNNTIVDYVSGKDGEKKHHLRVYNTGSQGNVIIFNINTN